MIARNKLVELLLTMAELAVEGGRPAVAEICDAAAARISAQDKPPAQPSKSEWCLAFMPDGIVTQPMTTEQLAKVWRDGIFWFYVPDEVGHWVKKARQS